MNRLTLTIAAALACSAGALAQDKPAATPPSQPAPEQPAATKPQQPAAPPASPAPAPGQPTLDELLGLPKQKPEDKPTEKPRPDPVDPTKTDLERKLSSREVAEGFKVAIELMGETADRIQTSRDTGLTTQRMQEDIIRKLDQLIKAAEQQQQQQRQSSRSRGQRDQQQNQPNQQQQQSPTERQEAGKGDPNETLDAPPGQDAAPNPGTAARGAAWGSLPERVRDALTQGDADKYSALYRKWTEAYYRRLAEEANK